MAGIPIMNIITNSLEKDNIPDAEFREVDIQPDFLQMVDEDITYDESKFGVVTEELEIKYENVEPILIPEVKDLSGRLRDILFGLEKATNCTVIPFSMPGFVKQVVEIKDHDIKEFRGEKFCFSRTVRTEVIKTYSDKIIKKLSSGLPFKESLWTVINYNGADYNTLKLSEKEWSLICSYFRQSNAKIYKTNTEDLVLSVEN